MVSAIVLGLSALVASGASGWENSLGEVLAGLPGLLRPLAQIAHDLALVWAVLLLVVAVLAHRRWALVRDMVLAAAVAFGLAVGAFRLVQGSWPDLGDLGSSAGPPRYPAMRLCIAAAVLVTASPHLARPLRYASRWILAASVVSTMALGVGLPGGVVGALAIGAAAAAIVHLVFGSPGGHPSVSQVEATLSELGVPVTAVRPDERQTSSVWSVRADDRSGRSLSVKVYGRDAWDTQLVNTAWRFLWYRDGGRPIPTGRLQQVEHEAFLALLAAQAGIAAPEVVAAGETQSGDAVLVTYAQGTPMADITTPEPDVLDSAWHSLASAHAAGLSPGRVDPAHLLVGTDGTVVLADWAVGRTGVDDEVVTRDRAQLLVATALVAGDSTAVDAGRRVLGGPALGGLLGYLQEAVLSRSLRRAVRTGGHDLDELRAVAATAAEVEAPQLVALRRVTWGSVVQGALLLLAATALVAGLSGLDWASVSDQLASMTYSWLVFGLLVAQAARASGALSVLGASTSRLPVGPVITLQFAIAYVNLAVPSSAARLAVVARFFQRAGAGGTLGAMATSLIDSVGNFVVQVAVIVATLAFGLGSIEFDIGRQGTSGSGGMVALILLGGVVSVLVVLLVPSLRRKILPTIREVRRSLSILRSPSHLAMVLGGNLLTQLLYAASLGLCARALGAEVGLADLIIINTFVSLFAGLLPVPGGIGVAEAGLTAGLVLAGLHEDQAFAIALVYRVVSFYLPPVWGWFALRTLRRDDYL